MRKLIIPFEVFIIALPFIAWQFGVISLARLGDVLVAIGVLGLVLLVLVIVNIRVPLGDVSQFLSLNEIIPIQRTNGKPSLAFLLHLFLLVIFPLTIGILLRLVS